MKPLTIRISAILASCLLAGSALAEDLTVLSDSEPKPQLPVVFKSEDGNLHPLNPQLHKLSIVHFWASWCVPCVKELPQVDAVAKAYAGKDLHLVAISLDTNIATVKKFYAEHHIANLTPYIDMGSASFSAAKLKGLPATIIFNKEGEEIASTEGPLNWTDKKVMDFIEGQLK